MHQKSMNIIFNLCLYGLCHSQEKPVLIKQKQTRKKYLFIYAKSGWSVAENALENTQILRLD